jgi:hypothetical protein
VLTRRFAIIDVGRANAPMDVYRADVEWGFDKWARLLAMRLREARGDTTLMPPSST